MYKIELALSSFGMKILNLASQKEEMYKTIKPLSDSYLDKM